MKTHLLILLSFTVINYQAIASKNQSNIAPEGQNNNQSFRVHTFNILKNEIAENASLSLDSKIIAINTLLRDTLRDIPFSSQSARRAVSTSAQSTIFTLRRNASGTLSSHSKIIFD